jgi:pyrimidine operon attenuation protein/uracil phosphoribosyltransferase
MSDPERTLVLDHDRVQRKLMRIAAQLHEEHFDEARIAIVGIAPRGTLLAQRLKVLIERSGGPQVDLYTLELDKQDPLGAEVKLDAKPQDLRDRTVVLVDDVLMSGRTLMYAAAHLVRIPLKRLTTVVLVDRRHRGFPIRADIVGLTLSTTMQEHISVELGKVDAVYLN